MNERRFDNDSLNAMFYTCTTFFAHRWQLSIIIYLFSGPKHFGEILKYHEGLSKKVLSTILRKLESKNIVKRTVYSDGSVVRAEYSLTQQGLELQPILNAVADWGKKYSPHSKG
ncbi:MAG: helix-turn-helix transcriptional regulator [Lachnospiraceae bacterium]|nr:helix-turn-helix transcriptional regulator [Lachnospiraceae bacterium]